MVVGSNPAAVTQMFCCKAGAVSVVLCKIIFVADLLGSQYLVEILQTSLTVKNNENVVKSGWMFRKTLAMKSAIFFRNE